MVVVGVFNRITFPAFLLLPSLLLLPHFKRKYVRSLCHHNIAIADIHRPLSFVFLTLSALFTAFLAICVDTASYTPGEFTFTNVFNSPVVTPLNNFIYNSDAANLAQHGIHPRYQHFLVNLPQLLGPAFPLLFFLRRSNISPILVSALSGVALLSIFPHQEARFLLPAVPLILSSIRVPSPQLRKVWIATWVIFNLGLGMLMGVYHQGGIVPVQMNIAKSNETITHAFWWKTYSPPTWLLNGKNEELTTIDLMGMPGSQMLEKIKTALPTCRTRKPPKIQGRGAVYLIAPRSAYFLTPYQDAAQREEISLEYVWSYRQHLNLDDMDFADGGVWPTLRRVVGDRGLVVWRVTRNCWATEASVPA
jgi:phosphatidylinositol glycan class Z